MVTRAMTRDLTRKALVLSDHDGLYRSLALHLNKGLGINVIRHEPDSPTSEPRRADDVDLVVLAQSVPAGEPIMVAAKTLLGGRIGRVPTLIISSEPFPSIPQARVFYLSFPFSIDGLYARVTEILQGGSPNVVQAHSLDDEKGREPC